MSEEKLFPKFTFRDERIARLAEIMPECVSDGRINIDVLQNLLSEEGVLEEESYGFTWPEKSKAQRAVSMVSTKTLKKNGKGKNEDKTKNLYIEGDNLEVLKILRKSYFNKIKCIYIDPPYNTGKEFIYKDNFAMNSSEYLKQRGLLGEEAEQLSSNPKSHGRYHTDWLNMMYSRLQIARELLTDNGVIFISIDDNEYAHLKLLCDEIFGENNFITSFVWTTKTAAKGVPPTTMLVSNHEYILCYSRNGSFVFNGISRKNTAFSNPDNDPRGPWKADNMKSTLRTAKEYSFTDPDTGWVFTDKWAFSAETVQKMIKEKRIIFPKSQTGQPRQKMFFRDYKNPNTPIKSVLDVFHTETATNKLKTTLDTNEKLFDFPKPVDLIQFLVEQSTKEDDIVLDFFSGSGTTAHAVMMQNSIDGFNRKYILIQAPENTGREDFTTIPHIARQRIKNVEKEITSRHSTWNQDVGFHSFEVTDSNYKTWTDYKGTDDSQLNLFFEKSVSALKEGFDKSHVITEILLMRGFSLTASIEKVSSITTNEVFKVVDENITERMFICLDEEIKQDFTDQLSLAPDDSIVALDVAMSTSLRHSLRNKTSLFII